MGHAFSRGGGAETSQHNTKNNNYSLYPHTVSTYCMMFFQMLYCSSLSRFHCTVYNAHTLMMNSLWSLSPQELWTKAKSEPLFNLLLDLNFYIFQCINYSAEQEELLDEKRRLCDIKPFWSTLRVVRKAGDVEDRVLNSQIGLCIGKSKLSSFMHVLYKRFMVGFLVLRVIWKSMRCGG